MCSIKMEITEKKGKGWGRATWVKGITYRMTHGSETGGEHTAVYTEVEMLHT